MAIFREKVACTPTTGGAGASTATAYTSQIVNGRIVAVYLEYLDSPPAGTTDVTITEQHNSPALPVLAVANAATDGWFHPMWQADNEAGAAITNQGKPIEVCDYLKVVIAQANDGDGVNATIVWDDGR